MPAHVRAATLSAMWVPFARTTMSKGYLLV